MHYTCVDSFSGAGGLCLGLEQAGFDILLSFDIDSRCIDTIRANPKYFGHPAEVADISDMLNGELLKRCNIKRGELFLLAGGPPCQGFSIQRRGDDVDIRNELVLKYGQLIDEIYPSFFVMENVSGIAGKRGRTILQQLIESTEEIGYRVHVELIDAQDYGVPQRRKRYIIVGERKDIISAYARPDTIGFAMAHAPKDLNPTLSQFVSFCWYYPDNDMCTRGNSHIYMNQYPQADAHTMENNVNSTLLANICELTGASSSEAARMVVFYSFAVLCSQVYLDEFEGALFTVNQSDKRARVPIVCDKRIFNNLCRMGEKLAELEKAGYTPDNVLNLDYDDILSRLPRGFHLQNSAHPFDEENELLVLSDGRSTIQIPCPIALQKLNISGYDVIKNAWLKFYSYDFAHCELTSEDIIELLNLLNRLTIHSRLVAQVDDLVYQILHNEVPLFLPEQ